MQGNYQIITKAKFLEEVNKAKNKEDREEVMLELYRQYASPDDVWDLMSDETSESYNMDELEYVDRADPEELYDDLFRNHVYWAKKKMREKVPWEIVKKYLSKQDLKDLKWFENQEVLNKI
jgi:hypothetical protein